MKEKPNRWLFQLHSHYRPLKKYWPSNQKLCFSSTITIKLVTSPAVYWLGNTHHILLHRKNNILLSKSKGLSIPCRCFRSPKGQHFLQHLLLLLQTDSFPDHRWYDNETTFFYPLVKLKTCFHPLWVAEFRLMGKWKVQQTKCPKSQTSLCDFVTDVVKCFNCVQNVKIVSGQRTKFFLSHLILNEQKVMRWLMTVQGVASETYHNNC